MALRISSSPRMDPGAWGKSNNSLAMGLLWTPLYIVYSFMVGGFLVILPSQRFWDNNFIVYYFPNIAPIVSSPFLKGAVLGLGIVNILIGIQELAILWKRSWTRISK
jgi:hypothetical protein